MIASGWVGCDAAGRVEGGTASTVAEEGYRCSAQMGGPNSDISNGGTAGSAHPAGGSEGTDDPSLVAGLAAVHSSCGSTPPTGMGTTAMGCSA